MECLGIPGNFARNEKGIKMFALFSQGQDGMQWLSTHDDLESATEAMNECTLNDTHDALFIIPVAGFKDLQV